MSESFIRFYDRLNTPSETLVVCLAAVAGMLLGGTLLWLMFTFQRIALAVWAAGAVCVAAGWLIERAHTRSAAQNLE